MTQNKTPEPATIGWEALDALYPPIVQAAVAAVPGNFKQLWATAEMCDDVSGTEIYYQTQAGTFHHPYDNIDALDDLLFALRKVFIASGKAPWSSVTLMVDEAGKFSLDYGYADVSDFDLAGERREQWLSQYLGSDATVIDE